MRLFAGHISETMDGYRDIHAHDTTAFELAKASQLLGALFRIRRSLYLLGNGVIFLNNIFTQLTPFMFYVVGGYLVVVGDLSLGALVAVVAAYRETATPWNDLLEYYQSLEDNRVKYAALVENFSPDDLRDIPESHRPEKLDQPVLLDGDLIVANVSVKDGEEPILDSVSLTAPLSSRVAILGPAGSGKVELAQLIGGLRRPTAGGISLVGQGLASVSAITLGRNVSYLDQGSHVFTGTWRDNLYYGLKHRPVRDADSGDPTERTSLVAEALQAGNTTNDLNADWIDFEDAGFDNRETLDREAVRMLRMVGLVDNVFEAGMREPLDPSVSQALAVGILQARRRFRELISQSDFADTVEFFDAGKFNSNASVSESLVFGELADGLDFRTLAGDEQVIQFLRDNGLLDTLVTIGHVATSNIVRMFRDLPIGDEQLGRFSVIDQEDMPAYESLLRRVPNLGGAPITDADRTLLFSVAFMLTPAKHRLGLIDNRVQVRLIAAREDLLTNVPVILKGRLEVHIPELISSGATVRSNIMFGRLALHRTQMRDRVEALIGKVIQELDLEPAIIELGLDASVGIAGGRLAPAQNRNWPWPTA